MERSYNLNPEHAKQADNQANRITETGKYVGTFTRAESIKSTKGTDGIEFAFKANDGRSADFLQLWTYNTDGKELYGLKMVNALMTCLKARSLTPTNAMVEKWDRDAGATGKLQATVYPELMSKPIGLLLQREEYEKQNGDIGHKFNIYGCFDSQTEMVASEILEKAAKAEKLPRIVQTLRDKPLDSKRLPASTGAPAPSGAFADMADDIPF